MSHKIYDNDLVAIRKNKVTSTLKPVYTYIKPAYIRMRIVKLSKVLMYEFHYNYIKITTVTTQDYYSQTLID